MEALADPVLNPPASPGRAISRSPLTHSADEITIVSTVAAPPSHPLLKRPRSRSGFQSVPDVQAKSAQDPWLDCPWSTRHYALAEKLTGYYDATVRLPPRRCNEDVPNTESATVRLSRCDPSSVTACPWIPTVPTSEDLAPRTRSISAPALLLADAHAPRTLSEFRGDPHPRGEILEWISTWHPPTPTPSFSSLFSDESADQGPPPPPVILVSGPVGCGKTASVYAAAAAQGRAVREINAATCCRTARNLHELLHEATQSHGVSGQRVLLLLEEVEHIREEEKGFWGGLAALHAESKVPIVLTCNVAHSVLERLRELGVGVNHARMSAPEIGEVCSVLVAVRDSDGGCKARTGDIRVIGSVARGDLRRALHEVQFWSGVGTPGDIVEGVLGVPRRVTMCLKESLKDRRKAWDSALESDIGEWIRAWVFRRYMHLANVTRLALEFRPNLVDEYHGVCVWSRLLGRLSSISCFVDDEIGDDIQAEVEHLALAQSFTLDSLVRSTSVSSESDGLSSSDIMLVLAQCVAALAKSVETPAKDLISLFEERTLRREMIMDHLSYATILARAVVRERQEFTGRRTRRFRSCCGAFSELSDNTLAHLSSVRNTKAPAFETIALPT